MIETHLAPVDTGEIPDYPLGSADRLDSHWFMAWERRRWLNSDMLLKGSPECRAYYFDLINIAYDQAPIGTLPNDLDSLAKLARCDPSHFRRLVQLEFGPLHRWSPCLCDGTEIRLMHPVVLRSLTEAVSRRADNQARTEAANSKKRRQRLRSVIAGMHVELAKNDAAILWMDKWLTERTGYRNWEWIERAVGAWSDRALSRGVARQGAGQ